MYNAALNGARMTEKCDIIGDIARAHKCGLCSRIAQDAADPDGANKISVESCSEDVLPKGEALCAAPRMANARMRLFSDVYFPGGRDLADRRANSLSKQIAYREIHEPEAALRAAYPDAGSDAVEIGWGDFAGCYTPDEIPVGSKKTARKFNRSDLARYGYHPVYPVGGTTAAGVVWDGKKSVSPIPVAVDYLMNPDLFTLVMFFVLIVLLATLVWCYATRAPPAAIGGARSTRSYKAG